MAAVRSYLYVPGDRPERLAKAFSRSADHLIVDLEDAVAVAAKDSALQTVFDRLETVPEKHAPYGFVSIRGSAGVRSCAVWQHIRRSMGSVCPKQRPRRRSKR